MAAAALQGLCEEATCAICLKYFKDPVTVECGHNFCRACLTQCWEGSGGEEVSCPQCREKVRRNLIPNRQLANIVEISKKLRLQGEKSDEGKGGVCGKHQEPLKLFCKEDQTLICVVCDRSKEHRDHDVVPLEEAAQDYKDLICRRLELLKEERTKILTYKIETEKESQELLKQTKAQMEKTKEQIRELRSILNKQEKLLLAQLEEVEKETARERDEHLGRLSRELSSLAALIQEVEQKSQQSPAELLQDVRNVLQSNEKKKPFQNPVPFSPELKWKIWDICDRNALLAKRMKPFKDISLLGSKLQKANVTLDPRTAHPYLFLSEDHKSVRHGFSFQDLPDNPERFSQCPFVLGCEGFTAGRHYWEVTVEREGDWALGVARKSVQRKDNVGLRTGKGIWAVGRWGGGYRASNLPKKSFLPLTEKPKRIWVSLNYEGGQVAFHDADTGSHLHTFSGASFSGETLLPFFYVVGKGLLISGLLEKAFLRICP